MSCNLRSHGPQYKTFDLNFITYVGVELPVALAFQRGNFRPG